MSRFFFGILLASLATVLAGCHNTNRRPAAAISPNVPGATFVPPPPLAPPVVPAPGFPNPPGNVNVAPPPGTILPNNAPPPGFANPPPPTPPGVSAIPGGSTQAHWRPAPTGSVQPVEARFEQPRIQLYAPEPLSGDIQATAKVNSPEPPLLNEKRAKSALPVGIPQFAKATDGVYAGLRPSIDDGLDWLQENAFRTVVHVHAPGAATDSDRKQVEKLGMRYVDVEVSPTTLTKAKVEEFTNLIRDVARQPLFVYDQDGSFAGPLWYLYFRTVDNHADDVARVKAGSLGLREDREGMHRLMWLATQKYLEANN
jgi:protein tyrosine phosphatase (PTP) superfamily phosphohydrolase (DUF442 family)